VIDQASVVRAEVPVAPRPSEHVLHSRTISAFAGSDLAARLTDCGIDMGIAQGGNHA